MIFKLLKFISILILVAITAAVLFYFFLLASEEKLDDSNRNKAPGEFLDTELGKIHYRWFESSETASDAPVIVMSHGWATPSHIFTLNAEALSEVGYRVLTFDHFGRGWSDRPKEPYNDFFYLTEMTLLLDGLEIKKPVGLVGLSMGGLTSSYYAANYPDKVKALFIFVPSGLDMANAQSGFAHALLMTPLVGDFIWRLIGKRVISNMTKRMIDRSVPMQAQLADDAGEQLRYEGYFQALLSSYRHTSMIDRGSVYNMLHETNVPVMAVFGGQDEVVLSSSVDRLNKIAPNIETSLISNGEHGLNYKQPGIANNLLKNFFNEHLMVGLED